MKKIIFCVIIFACYTTGYAFSITEQLGHFFNIRKITTHSLYFTINQLGKNKFRMEADLRRYITFDEMLVSYKEMANRLCRPKIAYLKYADWQSFGSVDPFSDNVIIRFTPKIVNIVSCR